jgi:hypothetical protein
MTAREVVGFLPQGGHFGLRGLRPAVGSGALKALKRLLEANQRRTRLGYWIIFYIFQRGIAITSNLVLSIGR